MCPLGILSPFVNSDVCVVNMSKFLSVLFRKGEVLTKGSATIHLEKHSKRLLQNFYIATLRLFKMNGKRNPNSSYKEKLTTEESTISASYVSDIYPVRA